LKTRVFVDGEHGTTGLKIREHLCIRNDIQLLEIPSEKRRDIDSRRELINESDVVFLCLPDDAARESVSLIENHTVCIIDGSTAHRTTPGWSYGLPEAYPESRETIRNSRRISVPGCHATGFNLIVSPLVRGGVLTPDYPFSCYSLTGYSGGGRAMIARYEAKPKAPGLEAPRMYSLELNHKHLPEMQKVAGLARAPLFTPIVGDYYQGEVVTVPLHKALLTHRLTPSELCAFYMDYYSQEIFIQVVPYPCTTCLHDGFLDPMKCNDTNRLDIFVFGNDEQIMVSARFDNLGKGASGAAIQNMNLFLGAPEDYGLNRGIA
jgi:N-acetyl-gamma-glutamyl-phosphate reductase